MSFDKKRSGFSHGLCPGSFDPITRAHIEMVRRFSRIFERLTVLTAGSVHKKYWFSLEERAEMAREALKGLPNVTVDKHEGLTADYMKKKGIFIALRGVRSVADFPYERDLAAHNKKIFPKMDTLFLFSEPLAEAVSAKWIKEIACHKGDLKGLVSPFVQKKIEKKILKGETI